MEKVVLNVKGMSCGHCKAAVMGALSKIDGVTNGNVNLESGEVSFDMDKGKASIEVIKNAIEDEGYDVE